MIMAERYCVAKLHAQGRQQKSQKSAHKALDSTGDSFSFIWLVDTSKWFFSNAKANAESGNLLSFF